MNGEEREREIADGDEEMRRNYVKQIEFSFSSLICAV